MKEGNIMKVSELIEQLKRMPQDAEVVSYDYNQDMWTNFYSVRQKGMYTYDGNGLDGWRVGYADEADATVVDLVHLSTP